MLSFVAAIAEASAKCQTNNERTNNNKKKV